MLTILRSINLALRFGLELCALAGLAYWGWQVPEALPARLLVAIGAPLIAACVWGLWVAPNSKRRMPDPWRLIPEACVFGSAALALIASGQPLLGVLLAVFAAVNRILLEVLGTHGA